MRLLLIVCCAILVSVGTFSRAQNDVAVQTADDSSVKVVEYVLQHPFSFGASFVEKQVSRLGDKASIALMKIFKGEELEDPRNVERYLPIISAAFRYPELISNVEDKKPTNTLLLLERLEGKFQSRELKQDITRVRRSVEEKHSEMVK